MQYICYELDEDQDLLLNWYERIVYAFARKYTVKENPDFHLKYEDVVYWWLELNDDSYPVREIGFNHNGIPIVAGPFGKNKGLFTSSKQKILGFYPIELYQFIEQWENFNEDYSQ